MSLAVSQSVVPAVVKNKNLLSFSSVIIPSQAEEDITFPTETPLDKEIHNAIVNKIIDAACVLRPGLKIDREIVIRALNTCVNDELSSRKLTKTIDLRRILMFAVEYRLAKLSIEAVSFVGSSVIYKLAESVIESLEASDAKPIVTPLFKANLKRAPHDSDWKIAITPSPPGSKIVFWNEVEAYARAIIRGIALHKCGTILPPTFDISAACLELGIDYEPRQDKFIHLSFRECGIDLTIGQFEKGGLFLDTLPEIELVPNTITANPRDLITELKDDVISIFQAAVLRGYKGLAVDDPLTKNDRASVQLIRRSLTGDVSLSETMYTTFLEALFVAYPTSSTWARDIAKKFCNINKGHSNYPIPRIIWSMFVFLCSLDRHPQYVVDVKNRQKAWHLLPFRMRWDGPSTQKLFLENPIYQIIHKHRLACDVIESILGIAGLLFLSFTKDCSSTHFYLSRQHGVNKAALWFTAEDEIHVPLEIDLLVFCRSLKIHYANMPLNRGSELSKALLEQFIEYAGLTESAAPVESVIDRNRKKMPCWINESAELAREFLGEKDLFLKVIGASVLVTLRSFDPNFVDEGLLCEAFPVLLNSSSEKVKGFALLLAKKYLSSLAQKESPPVLKQDNSFFFPFWLNSLTGTKNKHCCEIAAKYWTAKLPAEKKYFQVYLTFMENLWKAYPITLISVWKSILTHSFDAAQQKQLFNVYVDKLLALPENDLALECLAPFVHYVNTCVGNFTLNEEGSKLHSLLQRISKERPALLSYCLHWLPLLSEEDIPLFNRGTIEEILQKKILSAKTAEEIGELCSFFLKNICLRDIFFTLVNPALYKALKGTPHLTTIYIEFIKFPSKCPKQKAHILLKLIDIGFKFESDLSKEIDGILSSLIKLKELPLTLIFKVLEKYSTISASTTQMHFDTLCCLAIKILDSRFGSTTRLAHIMSRYSPLILASQSDLMLRMLRVMTYETEKGSLDIALKIAFALKKSDVPLLAWESLIIGMKKYARHTQDRAELVKVKDFSQQFVELKALFHQLELELLAYEVSFDLTKAKEQAESLIALSNQLSPAQNEQLSIIVQRMLRQMAYVKVEEAIDWLKHSSITTLINADEHAVISGIILTIKFDPVLFLQTLKTIEKLPGLSENQVYREFVSSVLPSQHLYYGCTSDEDRVKRLLFFSFNSDVIWKKKVQELVQELLINKSYALCLKVFQHPTITKDFPEVIASTLNPLLQAVKYEETYLFSELIKFAIITPRSLKISVWGVCLQKMASVKDLKLKTKFFDVWTATYPIPCADALLEKSPIERDAHFRALQLVSNDVETLRLHYFKDPSVVEVLLRHNPKEAKVTEVSILLLSHLLETKKESLPWILVTSLLTLIEIRKEHTVQVVVPLFILLKAAFSNVQKDVFQTVIKKITTCVEYCEDTKVCDTVYKLNAKLLPILQEYLEIIPDDDPHQYLLFLKILKILPDDSVIWIQLLQRFVNHHAIFTKSLSHHYDTLLITILRMATIYLLKSSPKSSRENCRLFFESENFISFMGDLCIRIHSNYDCLKRINDFLFLCQKYKLLLEEKTREWLVILLKATLEASSTLDAKLDAYFDFAPYIVCDSEEDKSYIKEAIQNVIKLLYQVNNHQHFNKYAKTLLNFAFFNPKGCKTDEAIKLDAITLSGSKTLSPSVHVSFIFENLMNPSRTLAACLQFIESALSEGTRLPSNVKQQYAEILTLYFHAIFKLSKKLVWEEKQKERIYNLLLMFGFLPQFSPHTFKDSLFSNLVDGVCNLGFFERGQVDNLQFLIAFFEKRASLLDFKRVAFLGGAIASLSPQSYVDFVKLLTLPLIGQKHPMRVTSKLLLLGIVCRDLKAINNTQFTAFCSNYYYLPLKTIPQSEWEENITHYTALIADSSEIFLPVMEEVLTFEEDRNIALLKEFLGPNLFETYKCIHTTSFKNDDTIDHMQNCLFNLANAISNESFELLLTHLRFAENIIKLTTKIKLELSKKHSAYLVVLLNYIFRLADCIASKQEQQPLYGRITALVIKSMHLCFSQRWKSNEICSFIKEKKYLHKLSIHTPVPYYRYSQESEYINILEILKPENTNWQGFFEAAMVSCVHASISLFTPDQQEEFIYHVMHCCTIWRKDSVNLHQNVSNLIIVVNLALTLNPSKATKGLLDLISEPDLLLSEDVKKVASRALLNLSSYPEHFISSFEKALSWLNTCPVDIQLKLAGVYIRLIFPFVKEEFRDIKTLKESIKNIWKNGRFDKYLILLSLIDSLLNVHEGVELLEFGIIEATRFKKIDEGMTLCLSAVNKSPSKYDSPHVRLATMRFLTSCKDRNPPISLLEKVVQCNVISILIADDLIGFRNLLLTIAQKYFIKNNTKSLLNLLEYYQKAVSLELRTNNYFSLDHTDDLIIEFKTLVAIVASKIDQCPNNGDVSTIETYKNYFKSLFSIVKHHFRGTIQATVALELYSICQAYPKLNFVNVTHQSLVIDCISALTDSTPTLATDYYLSIVPSMDDDAFILVVKLGFSVIHKALQQELYEEAERILFLMLIKCDSSLVREAFAFFRSDLIKIKDTLINNHQLDAAFACFQLIDAVAQTTITTEDKCRLYDLAIDNAKYITAATVAKRYNLWTSIDSNELLEGILNHVIPLKSLEVVFDIFRNHTGNFHPFINRLIPHLEKYKFTRDTGHLVALFLEQVESLNPISPDILRVCFWKIAFRALNESLQCFSFISLLRAPISEAGFDSEDMRRNFQIQQLKISLKNTDYTVNNLEAILTLRKSFQPLSSEDLRWCDSRLLEIASIIERAAHCKHFIKYIEQLPTNTPVNRKAKLQLSDSIIKVCEHLFCKNTLPDIEQDLVIFFSNYFRLLENLPQKLELIKSMQKINSSTIQLKALNFFSDLKKQHESPHEKAMREILFTFSEFEFEFVKMEAILQTFTNLIDYFSTKRVSLCDGDDEKILSNVLLNFLISIPISQSSSNYIKSLNVYCSKLIKVRSYFKSLLIMRLLINGVVAHLLRVSVQPHYNENEIVPFLKSSTPTVVKCFITQDVDLFEPSSSYKNAPLLISFSNCFWNINSYGYAIIILVSELLDELEDSKNVSYLEKWILEALLKLAQKKPHLYIGKAVVNKICSPRHRINFSINTDEFLKNESCISILRNSSLVSMYVLGIIRTKGDVNQFNLVGIQEINPEILIKAVKQLIDSWVKMNTSHHSNIIVAHMENLNSSSDVFITNYKIAYKALQTIVKYYKTNMEHSVKAEGHIFSTLVSCVAHVMDKSQTIPVKLLLRLDELLKAIHNSSEDKSIGLKSDLCAAKESMTILLVKAEIISSDDGKNRFLDVG